MVEFAKMFSHWVRDCVCMQATSADVAKSEDDIPRSPITGKPLSPSAQKRRQV